jgi:predicted transcriptional regulator
MQKTNKNDPTPMTLRLPPDLVERLDAAAEQNGRTRTAEIRARLEPSETELRLAAIERELQEMKGMLRKLLDAAG